MLYADIFQPSKIEIKITGLSVMTLRSDYRTSCPGWSSIQIDSRLFNTSRKYTMIIFEPGLESCVIKRLLYISNQISEPSRDATYNARLVCIKIRIKKVQD